MGHDLLGDLFFPCEVLPVVARRRLAGLLPVAGRPPALLPADLRSHPLPHDADGRAAVSRAITTGLESGVLAQLAGWRLHDVVPAIRGRHGGVAAGACPPRARSVLECNGATTWYVLGGCTLGEIGEWSGVGPTMTAALVGLALETGLAFLADDTPRLPARSAPPPGTVVADDVSVLLWHDQQTGRGELRLAIERFIVPGLPARVEQAAARLLAVATEDHDPRLVLLDRALQAMGDERDRGVFEYRLRLSDRPTMSELGAALGIGTERVRQLRCRAEERLRAAVEHSPEGLHELAASVADRLGDTTTTAAVDAVLASLHLPPLPDTRSLLLLWLAGPYHPVEEHRGWVAKDPAGLLTETSRLLHEDGGVRLIEHVVKEFEVLGMEPEHVEAWLATQPVRVTDGLVVATTGDAAAVAERALFAAGRAMTVDELSGWARPGRGARGGAGLWGVLQRDDRFIRVGPDCFELAEWGSEPYEDPVGAGPGGRLGPARDGRWWLRIDVDDHVLAGKGGPAPVALVEALDLRRGARRTFSTRYGPVALRYDTQPSRASVRPIVLATGAAAGDTLLLGFRPDDATAAVELVRLGPSPTEPLDLAGGST